MTEEDGPVWLKTSVGIDLKGYQQHCPKNVEFDVRYEVHVNDESHWSDTIHVSHNLHESKRAWKHVGGKSGLPLKPGDRVRLTTSFASDHTPETVEKYRIFLGGWADLLLESETPTPRIHSSPEAPNVVLIVMDTLRADRLSNYGYGRDTSPNLTRLADRGIQYDRAYSTSSWTWPSTASMLTGLYPQHHGVVSNAACTLSYQCESVAEVLQERGFTTGGFSCNPLVHEDRYYDQGFEHFNAAKHFRKGDEINPAVFDWLDQNYGSRFFLYLHMADPHTPHRPHPDDLQRFAGSPPEDPPEVREDRPGQKQHEEWDWFDYYSGQIDGGWDAFFAYRASLDPKATKNRLEREARRVYNNKLRGPDEQVPPEKEIPPAERPVLNEIVPPAHQKWVADVYDASVASCDRYVGEVLDRLEELGLEDRTIVIFTADHGEELLEHGRYGHGQSLFEEVVHVPLIVAGPGVQHGVRINEPVSNRHVAPTLAWRGDANLEQVPSPQDLTQPHSIQSESVQIQTYKGKLDGRRMFRMEGVVLGDHVLHYSRRVNTASLEVIYAKNVEPKRPVDQHLRFYDLSVDPAQLQFRKEAIKDSDFVSALLKTLDDQAALKRGEVLPAGSSGLEDLIKMGYVESGAEKTKEHELKTE